MTVFPKREDVLRRQTPPLGRGRGREPAGSGDARRQDAAAAAAGAAGLKHRGPALPDPAGLAPGAGAGRAGPRGCRPPPAAGVALCPRPPPTHGAPALTGPGSWREPGDLPAGVATAWAGGFRAPGPSPWAAGLRGAACVRLSPSGPLSGVAAPRLPGLGLVLQSGVRSGLAREDAEGAGSRGSDAAGGAVPSGAADNRAFAGYRRLLCASVRAHAGQD